MRIANEYEPYKPLSNRSKFKKANNWGQVPVNCINFNFCGKHCSLYGEELTDCVVLKGEYCEKGKWNNDR